jgi:hypothetical protein
MSTGTVVTLVVACFIPGLMALAIFLGKLLKVRRHETKRAGCCEVCGDYGIIYLDGQRILCWECYVEEMQRIRDHKT